MEITKIKSNKIKESFSFQCTMSQNEIDVYLREVPCNIGLSLEEKGFILSICAMRLDTLHEISSVCFCLGISKKKGIKLFTDLKKKALLKGFKRVKSYESEIFRIKELEKLRKETKICLRKRGLLNIG